MASGIWITAKVTMNMCVTRKEEKMWFKANHIIYFLIHTNASWLTSPSGTNMVWTMNLCLFRSVWDSMSKGCNMTAISADCFGSTIPLLGRTQYRFGAVVLTLKHILRSFGLLNFRCEVTTSVNGPEKLIEVSKIKKHDNIELVTGRVNMIQRIQHSTNSNCNPWLMTII